MSGATAKAASRRLLKILGLSLMLAGIFYSPSLVAEPRSHTSNSGANTPSSEADTEKVKAHADNLSKASDKGIKDIAEQMKKDGVDSLSKDQLEKAFSHLDSDEGKTNFSEEDLKDLKDKITVAYEKFKTKTPDGEGDAKGDSAKSGDSSKSPATSSAAGAERDASGGGDAGGAASKPYLTLGSGVPSIGIPVVDNFVQAMSQASRNLGLPSSPEARKLTLGNFGTSKLEKANTPVTIKKEEPIVSSNPKATTPLQNSTGGGYLEAPVSSNLPVIVSSQAGPAKVEALDSNFFMGNKSANSEGNAFAAAELTPYASPVVVTPSPAQTSSTNPLRPLGATTNVNTQLANVGASEEILGTASNFENPLPLINSGSNERAQDPSAVQDAKEEKIAAEDNSARQSPATGATLGAQAAALAVLSQNSVDKSVEYSEPKASAPDSVPAQSSLNIASSENPATKVPGVRGPDLGNMLSFANQVQ